MEKSAKNRVNDTELKGKLSNYDAFVWSAEDLALNPVAKISRVPLCLLKGIDSVRDTLYANTERFANGLPANNALLWGARGMGKSSLVKAIHGEINAPRKPADRLILIEIHREDISTLPRLLNQLRGEDRQFLLYCDDLSFDKGDTSYKSLKGALEGGLEGRPENVLFYATSNRRHLLAREMADTDNAITATEAMEEQISLSDRFGLWLGFHHCSQDEYLAMVASYISHFGLKVTEEDWKPRAIAWSVGRGARSGRVAWQFIQDLAGALGQQLCHSA